MSKRMTPEAERAIETSFDNSREAHELLALIDAEFRTDPTSIQCFDSRIVQRVAYCVALRKRLILKGVIFE